VTAKDSKFVSGATRLSKRIATIRAGLGIAALQHEVAALMLRRTEERFDREVDPDNKSWRALARVTREAKRRAGVGGILKRTLLLRQSLQIIRGTVTDAVYTNTGAGFRIGVSGPAAAYGRHHQHGTPTIPKRRFLGVGALDIRSVDGFLRRRADKVIGTS
jgi:phage gpG-like protein